MTGWSFRADIVHMLYEDTYQMDRDDAALYLHDVINVVWYRYNHGHEWGYRPPIDTKSPTFVVDTISLIEDALDHIDDANVEEILEEMTHPWFDYYREMEELVEEPVWEPVLDDYSKAPLEWMESQYGSLSGRGRMENIVEPDVIKKLRRKFVL